MRVLISSFLAIASFVFRLSSGMPRFMLMRLAERLRGTSESERRRAAGRWKSDVGRRGFADVARIMRLRVERGATTGLIQSSEPLIVIANHRSPLDIPALCDYLSEFGRVDLRWVLKKQLGWLPLIGWPCSASGDAFVSRCRDARDLDRIRQCAEKAYEDGACVVLFPEGKRFNGAVPESGLTHVRPPKIRGFEEVCRAMPGARILNVTIHCDGVKGGRTLFRGATAYYGKRVMMTSVLGTIPKCLPPADWLKKTWEEKDLYLSTVSASS